MTHALLQVRIGGANRPGIPTQSGHQGAERWSLARQDLYSRK
eukprot:CAMPEP_0204349582 /NCGR_PEP_ID=MMETSP0469-20131031/29643_1 /ASSEMBLY_ACC=CAM_ASM_000384 /TAXON_ID=2969 /ORGANISM="Oxyrrhis marina" /LENGTH=41 /DNA_ID= /DNA_START= /DNA_END= /DNA_ORIENTATION=